MEGDKSQKQRPRISMSLLRREQSTPLLNLCGSNSLAFSLSYLPKLTFKRVKTMLVIESMPTSSISAQEHKGGCLQEKYYLFSTEESTKEEIETRTLFWISQAEKISGKCLMRSPLRMIEQIGSYPLEPIYYSEKSSPNTFQKKIS